jgi:hypothetical protein
MAIWATCTPPRIVTCLDGIPLSFPGERNGAITTSNSLEQPKYVCTNQRMDFTNGRGYGSLALSAHTQQARLKIKQMSEMLYLLGSFLPCAIHISVSLERELRINIHLVFCSGALTPRRMPQILFQIVGSY